MKTVDESIDEKGQKLFKIRDELSKLSEQSRMLQSKLNQLSITQAEYRCFLEYRYFLMEYRVLQLNYLNLDI